jgi:hypothetical protein
MLIEIEVIDLREISKQYSGEISNASQLLQVLSLVSGYRRVLEISQ